MQKVYLVEEINGLDKEVDDLRKVDPKAAVLNLYKAAKSGSGVSCLTLAHALDPKVTVFPPEFALHFVKNRRKANRFYNRALKCYRRLAQLGCKRSMFCLYNAHHFGHHGLNRASSRMLAEIWLRKVAQHGDEIPKKELALFVRQKTANKSVNSQH